MADMTDAPSSNRRYNFIYARDRANCFDCPLSALWYLDPPDKSAPVLGQGPGASLSHAPVMIIGEGPGEQENEHGVPFYRDAPSGRELNNLCTRMGLDRYQQCYVTNVVKCRPPKNRDPKPLELQCCSSWLKYEIAEVRPDHIITVGRFSTRALLGNNVDMETVHGIPHQVFPVESDPAYRPTVIPCYHIAAGLKAPETMNRVQYDFQRVSSVLHGEKFTAPEDLYKGAEKYVLATARRLELELAFTSIVAIDTETLPTGSSPGLHDPVWCVTVCMSPGKAYFIPVTDIACLEVLKKSLTRPNLRIVFHKALFDIPVLESLGVTVPLGQVEDTMDMAYLLQVEPLGLKSLAKRHCGMDMEEYEDVLRDAQETLTRAYLKQAAGLTLPNPPPITELRNGVYLQVQPQNVVRKVKKLLMKHDVDVYILDTKTDLTSSWLKLDPERGRNQVEQLLGPLPRATLADIPIAEARYYACRDADATLRVHRTLSPIIQSFDLWPVVRMDCDTLPMVIDMHRSGIEADVSVLKDLGEYFGTRAEEAKKRIYDVVSKRYNLNSPDEVSDMLFKELKLPPQKQPTKKPNGKIVYPTGEREVLSPLKGTHPVVDLLLEYRQYTKLRSTYAEAALNLVDVDGRVHANFSLTSTSTGRLSCSKPNLMAQPVRTSEGKLIR
ncbi:DNA polymerase, partial [Candidatus Magnetobacterium casense]